MKARFEQRAKGKRRFGVVIAALAIAILAACAPPTPPAPPASACSGPGAPPDAFSVTILNATNGSRAGSGLAPLSWNGQLWCLASEWSVHLVGVNALVHRDLGATIRQPDYGGYQTLGENLLRGPDGMGADAMHAAWMNSAGHRANLLNPAFSSMAIALAWGNGSVFATENFGG
jgi:uncharacterized protein YkwD